MNAHRRIKKKSYVRKLVRELILRGWGVVRAIVKSYLSLYIGIYPNDEKRNAVLFVGNTMSVIAYGSLQSIHTQNYKEII